MKLTLTSMFSSSAPTAAALARRPLGDQREHDRFKAQNTIVDYQKGANALGAMYRAIEETTDKLVGNMK